MERTAYKRERIDKAEYVCVETILCLNGDLRIKRNFILGKVVIKIDC